MKFFYLIALLILTLPNCEVLESDKNINPKQLLLGSKNVEGLRINDLIYIDSNRIGKVKDFKLNGGTEVIIICKLDEVLTLPDDSQFLIKHELLGGSKIIITKGESKQFFSSKDTCRSEIFLPSFLDEIESRVDIDVKRYTQDDFLQLIIESIRDTNNPSKNQADNITNSLNH